jgi:hypothetical protein
VDLPSEQPHQLPSALPTTSKDRMLLTELTGTAARIIAHHPGRYTEYQVQELLAITTDPMLWGVLLGWARRRAELGETGHGRLVELAQRVGADEQTAQTHQAWLRAQPGC